MSIRDHIPAQLEELWDEWFHRLVVALVTGFAVTAVASPLISDYFRPYLSTQGQVAISNVYAPHDLLIENAAVSEKRRAGAAQETKRVFSIDRTAVDGVPQQVDAVFAALQELSTNSADRGSVLSLTDQAKANFEREYGIDLDNDEWDLVVNSAKWPEIQDAVSELLSPVLKRGVLANKIPLEKVFTRGQQAVLRDRSGSGQEEPLESAEALFSEDAARREVARQAAKITKNPGTFDAIVVKIASSLLKPNVVYDVGETERRIAAARESVESTFFRVRRGELIVRAGDVISAAQQLKLEATYEQRTPEHFTRSLIAYELLTVMLLATVFIFAITAWNSFRPQTRDLWIVSITLIGTFVMIKAFAILATSLGLSFDYIDSTAFLLATPVAAGGILLQVTLGLPSVFVFTLCAGLLTALFFEHSWMMVLLVIVGNFVGALRMKRSPRRSAFIGAGVWVAFANLLVVLCYSVLFPEYTVADSLYRMGFAVCGGVLSGLLSIGLTPVAEAIGGYVTDIKLLELASLDRPLLRELSVEAPGTWNHSMVMGQLVEVASDAIGANGILARVGAYYHDIGKVKKPLYFVENQLGKENKHDRLTPSMSALIIKSHVKEGVELAEYHRVPKAIVDFICQHHGTSLIEFFYDKALKEAADDEIVEEASYRYPGPKPQTKEAGILMLADAIEAVSRTLQDPSHAKIQGLVQKMINKIFASGQLDESHLTLHDLHIIAKSFVRVLNGIFHRRINYSEAAERREQRVKQQVKTEPVHEAETPAAGEGGENAAGPAEASQKDPAKIEPSAHFGQKEQPAGTDTVKEPRPEDKGRSIGEANGGKRAQDGSAKKGAAPDSHDPIKRLGI